MLHDTMSLMKERVWNRINLTHLHCANHPCSVTAPASSESVVSGNFCVAHGFPGEVLSKSLSSSGFKAPS